VGNRIRGGAGGKPYPGWSRRETVSGVEPAGNRIRGEAGGKPYPGWSRWETVSGSSPGSPHAVDRGDIAIGGGADGEGELVPPPLSPTLQPSYFSPASLARAFAGIPIPFSPAPPPPAPSPLRPRPRPGAGAVRGDIRGAAVSGVQPVGKPCPEIGVVRRPSWRGPVPVLLRPIPTGWTVASLATGGGPAMPGIYPDGCPPFSPLSDLFPYISGEVTAPGAGCPPGLSGGNVSAACMWAGAVCGAGLLKLYMG